MTTGRLRGAIAAGVLAASVAAISAAPTSAAPTSASSHRVGVAQVTEAARRTGDVRRVPSAPGRVTVIGDSVFAGLRTNGQLGRLVGSRWDVRFETCRRLVSSSCAFGRDVGPPTAFDEIESIARSGGADRDDDVLVIATGHNDSDANLHEDVAAIMDAASRAGFERVGWVLYRDRFEPGLAPTSRAFFSTYSRMNGVLRSVAASGEQPRLVLLEYGGYTRDHPDWFASDGIHLTKVGAVHVADWLSWVIGYDRSPGLRP